MSALGHKQTFALHQPMSALPAKADITAALKDQDKNTWQYKSTE